MSGGGSIFPGAAQDPMPAGRRWTQRSNLSGLAQDQMPGVNRQVCARRLRDALIKMPLIKMHKKPEI
jgi:hypothetical protein